MTPKQGSERVQLLVGGAAPLVALLFGIFTGVVDGSITRLSHGWIDVAFAMLVPATVISFMACVVVMWRANQRRLLSGFIWVGGLVAGFIASVLLGGLIVAIVWNL